TEFVGPPHVSCNTARSFPVSSGQTLWAARVKRIGSGVVCGRQHPCWNMEHRWPRLAWRLHEIAGVVRSHRIAVEHIDRWTNPARSEREEQESFEAWIR